MRKIKKHFDFSNKVVFITGSEGKLGRSLKKTFTDLGAKVYGLDRKKSPSKNIFKADISKEIEIQKIIDKIVKAEKKIDVIINNAGVSVYKPFEKRTSRDIDFTLNVNLKGLINVTKTYFKIHKKNKLKS